MLPLLCLLMPRCSEIVLYACTGRLAIEMVVETKQEGAPQLL